jgi:hypothetical protein
MKKTDPDRLLAAWLPCLDIEYLSDELYAELFVLDINDPLDQERIIERSFIPEFLDSNAVTRNTLMDVLDEVPDYPEAKVRELLKITSPLAEKLNDYKAFFERVKRRCKDLPQ